jgi:hypothetical protein
MVGVDVSGVVGGIVGGPSLAEGVVVVLGAYMMPGVGVFAAGAIRSI